MTSGLGISTDMALVDSMINRGGLLSMMPSVALIIGAAVFSSALKATGVFQMFLDAIQKYATGRKSLLGFSYLLHLILASFTGVYLVTFSIVGPILGPMFDKYDLDRKNLSRMLEDTGTAFSPDCTMEQYLYFYPGHAGSQLLPIRFICADHLSGRCICCYLHNDRVWDIQQERRDAD